MNDASENMAHNAFEKAQVLITVVPVILSCLSLLLAPLSHAYRNPNTYAYAHSIPDQQAAASHLLGNWQAHGGKHSRGNIAEDSLLLLQTPALGGVGHDEGHLVGGVRRLGLAIGELHLLGVAVVGRDEEDVAVLLASLIDLANGLVRGRAANDGSLVHTSVTNHVGRSKVVHDEGELALTKTLDNLLGDTVGAHLGSLVVGGDALVGGHKILALVTDLEREHLLNTTVEKEGDVGILLRLGNVNLLDALLAQPLGKHIAHVLGLESNLEGVVDLVLGHGDQVDLGVGEIRED